MSRVNFGAKPLMYPQPVLIIATYEKALLLGLDVLIDYN